MTLFGLMQWCPADCKILPSCGEARGNRFRLGPGEAVKCYLVERSERRLWHAVCPVKKQSRFGGLKMWLQMRDVSTDESSPLCQHIQLLLLPSHLAVSVQSGFTLRVVGLRKRFLPDNEMAFMGEVPLFVCPVQPLLSEHPLSTGDKGN